MIFVLTFLFVWASLVSADTFAEASNKEDSLPYHVAGPEFTYLSSGAVVPFDDKFVAAVGCDGDFEVAWLEKYGNDKLSTSSNPKVAAVLSAVQLAIITSRGNRTEKKELFMKNCLAEKDMKQTDETVQTWWPGRKLPE